MKASRGMTTSHLYPLRFEPIHQYRPWGSKRLACLFPEPLPDIGTIGEAWLLSDEHAIRSAAGNPNGRAELGIPGKREWERNKNPKQILFDALKAASELNARALKKFSPDRQRLRVAELTTDFSGLRGLASFDQFEATLKSKLFGEK